MRAFAAVLFWILALVALMLLTDGDAGTGALLGGALIVVGALWLEMKGMERRIAELERIAGTALGQPQVQPERVMGAPAASPTTAPVTNQPESAPATSHPVSAPVTSHPISAFPEPTPATAPFDWAAALRVILGPLAGQASPAEAEQQIGIFWFSRLGGLLLVASSIVGYFLLPSALLQAVIGWIVGLVIIGAGAWAWRAGYRPWSQAVTGAGVGILYAVSGAAAVSFSPALLSRPFAFGLMALITTGATALAVGYNSPALGLLGMLGGFATPFVLSSGDGDFRVLFAYLAILDLGLLAVAWFRRWPLYNQILFVATWSIWGLWRADTYTPADATAGFLFTSLFFLLFIGVSVLYNLVHRQAVVLQELLLLLLNGFLYFTAGLDFLGSGAPRALFAFGVAALYAALGLYARRRSPADRALTLGFLGLGVTFLTVAFPVAFDGPWVTLAWAMEGLGLTLVGARSELRSALGVGLALYGLAIVRLLFLDGLQPHQWLLVVRAADFLGVAAALYAGAWLYHRNRPVLPSQETIVGPGTLLGVLAVAANVVTLWWISLEIIILKNPVSVTGYGLAAAWSAYGLLLALVAWRWPNVGPRLGARLVLVAPLLALLPLSYFGTAMLPLRLSVSVGLLGAIWLAEYLFRPTAERFEGVGLLSLVATVVGAFLLRLEVDHWADAARLRLAKEMALSVRTLAYAGRVRAEQLLGRVAMTDLALLALYALVVMLVVNWLRSRSGKLVAAGLFGLTFLIALTALEPGLAAPPVLRMATFGALVGGACLAGYLARRQGEDARLHGVLSLGAAALTAYWGALEASHWLDPGSPLWPMAIWLGLYGLVLVALCLWLRSLEGRFLGFASAALGLILGQAVATEDLTHWPRWLAWAVPAGALWLFPYLVRRFRREEEEIDLPLSMWAGLAAAALALPWLYLEASHWPGIALPSFLVSALWGGWGFLVLTAGFLIRHRLTRMLAFGIVGLTLLKVGLIDMWTLAFVWRVWIGAGIGTLLLLASLAYQRFGARLLQ
ncbi:MAG TPA: DUF2339 domain-containing protein [Symbiobacteriaceae bacterium]|nr:DUF2339 domain-containing protein [Symbiobacteriaceae bacterium]